jgi:hypothetical protein
MEAHMCWRSVVVGLALFLGATCGQNGDRPVSPQGLTAPSELSAASQELPWKANLEWSVSRLEWPAGAEPFTGVTSLFGGRCSEPSDYVIYARFAGQATHAGRFTGEGSHCSQLHMTPQGPGAVTYSDGRGTLVAANGSTLSLRWGNGTTGVNPATGLNWFRDRFTFVGGTGLFEGATGGGEEGGSFTDFQAILTGTPAAMWMEGTITYGPGKR